MIRYGSCIDHSKRATNPLSHEFVLGMVVAYMSGRKFKMGCVVSRGPTSQQELDPLRAAAKADQKNPIVSAAVERQITEIDELLKLIGPINV